MKAKIIKELLLEHLTLSDIFNKINIPDFKNFLIQNGYDFQNLDDVIEAIYNWGEYKNINFYNFNKHDVDKVGEFIMDKQL